jgi:S-adenosylmethionine/arginine decarboxylase-like enzyme
VIARNLRFDYSAPIFIEPIRGKTAGDTGRPFRIRNHKIQKGKRFMANVSDTASSVPVRESPSRPWGLASSIDIYDCDPEIIRDAEKIRLFVIDLCRLIDMKRFGETLCVHFGEDERVSGYSMVQLIETSLISAHFANQSNTTYLDIFSCKPYDPQQTADFAKDYFGGSRFILNVKERL